MTDGNGTFSITMEDFSEEFIREWNRKRYCTRCGSPLRYDSLGEYRCMSCGKSELDDYGKVRKYLDENGAAPARLIEAETGVSVVIINELLEKGKIQIAGDAASYLKCKMCGRPIKFGKLCPICAAKQTDGLKDIYAEGYVGEEIAEKTAADESPKSTQRAKPRMYTWVKRSEKK